MKSLALGVITPGGYNTKSIHYVIGIEEYDG